MARPTRRLRGLSSVETGAEAWERAHSDRPVTACSLPLRRTAGVLRRSGYRSLARQHLP